MNPKSNQLVEKLLAKTHSGSTKKYMYIVDTCTMYMYMPANTPTCTHNTL